MEDPDDKLLEEPPDEPEESTESRIVVRDESTAPGEQMPESDVLTIPEELPILPLRGVVVYPHTVVPLTIGQPRSIRLVDDVAGKDRLIGLVASRKPELEQPGPDDLYAYGTVANVQRLFRAPDGTIRMIVQGLARFELGEFSELEPYLRASILLWPEEVEEGVEIEAQMRAASDMFQEVAELAPSLPREVVGSVLLQDDPLQVAYTIANYQRMELEVAQELLEENSTVAKLQHLNALLSREIEVLALGQQIQDEAREEIEKVQREFFLREQLKAIQRELGEVDEQAAEVEEFREKIAQAGLPEEAEKQAKRELDRLSKLPTAAAEFGVIRTYLDWMVSLPWSKETEDNLDLEHANQVLDEDHYGLEDVKERILEYLAVRKLKLERNAGGEEKAQVQDEIRREREGAILCFVGPPGVGKTSLGRSIARATGREFIRISLGGVHDEAEIRGHRRTYIGALPGRILQALRRVESRNPIFMMDEIDKLGRDFRGDPASALLEVLDPEQNSEFRDHYLEVAYDLSKVMFITTANWLDTIPSPLLDRMEVIRLSGYTEGEKVIIAKDYLIPRQIRDNGLREDEITFTEPAIRELIQSYTREAGVRNLEREIGRVCRKVATQVAAGKTKKKKVTPAVVTELLGRARYLGPEEIADRTRIPGVAAGLAWTPTGGEVLFIEATAMKGGKEFKLTGSLGDVMKESAQAALSYIRSVSESLGIKDSFWSENDIHLHIPAGSQPKDGPSAGIAMASALASLATRRAVRSDVTMTGEITLRGKVLPIGGIKEKVLAAHRAGLKTVILPKRNEVDLEDVPDEVKEVVDFVFVDMVDEVLDAALESKPKRAAKAKKKSPPKSGKKKTSSKAKTQTAKKKPVHPKKSESQEPVGAPS
ncbi:MAG: endopeptidase La [Anaerolineales bacterium]